MGEITVGDLKRARMQPLLFLDGDTYTNTYQCVEYPELTRTRYGPTWPATGTHRTVWRVNGDIVPSDLAAIVKAINAHRAEPAA